MDKHHITISSLNSTLYIGAVNDFRKVFEIDLQMFKDDESFELRILDIAKLVKSLGFKSVTYRWFSQSSSHDWHEQVMSIDSFVAWSDPAEPRSF